MQDDTPGEVTRLLKAWCKGDARALERLAPMVEQELRRLARVYLQREAAGHTLQPTALVNEAYLRLLDWNTVEWRDRAHFLAVAAKMMRRILVNYAIARRRQKRGGSAVLLSLAEADSTLLAVAVWMSAPALAVMVNVNVPCVFIVTEIFDELEPLR